MTRASDLHRYWFTFNGGECSFFNLGVGVTARTREEAMSLVMGVVDRFGPKDRPGPTISGFVEDVAYSQLEENHVTPNIGTPEREGVWFPAMNSTHADKALAQAEWRRPFVRLKIWLYARVRRIPLSQQWGEYLETIRSQHYRHDRTLR